MKEQGEKLQATAWFALFYDRELRRRAAKLYYWISALVFGGIGVWWLTPYASFTPDSAGMSASMKVVTKIVGSAVLFGISIAYMVAARRANADGRQDSEDTP